MLPVASMVLMAVLVCGCAVASCGCALTRGRGSQEPRGGDLSRGFLSSDGSGAASRGQPADLESEEAGGAGVVPQSLEDGCDGLLLAAVLKGLGHDHRQEPGSAGCGEPQGIWVVLGLDSLQREDVAFEEVDCPVMGVHEERVPDSGRGALGAPLVDDGFVGDGGHQGPECGVEAASAGVQRLGRVDGGGHGVVLQVGCVGLGGGERWFVHGGEGHQFSGRRGLPCPCESLEEVHTRDGVLHRSALLPPDTRDPWSAAGPVADHQDRTAPHTIQGVANASKSKGVQGERDAVTMWCTLHADLVNAGKPMRMLGAGRKEDVGDLNLFADVAVQVKTMGNVGAAIREAARGAKTQAVHAGLPLGVGMARIPRRNGTTAEAWAMCALEGQWPARAEAVAEFANPAELNQWLYTDQPPRGFRVWPREQRVALLTRAGTDSVLVGTVEAWADALHRHRWEMAAPVGLAGFIGASPHPRVI